MNVQMSPIEEYYYFPMANLDLQAVPWARCIGDVSPELLYLKVDFPPLDRSILTDVYATDSACQIKVEKLVPGKEC